MAFEYSESSFTPKITEQDGIRILDPNPNGQIVPHEDLFIYISLVAKQRSKSVITKTDDKWYQIDTQYLNSIDLVTPQQQVDGNRLFKNKPNLTTSWTEIGGHPASVNLGKDYEGFGITNIDVKIQSQTAPQVTINFTDVRGATLFEQGSCSPYSLFFTMPYPIFSLTLKGYYGRSIQYYLNLVKFNSKFNSDTGNMDCTAEFIGYSFAFLSDMIMGYVIASQKLKEDPWKPQFFLKKTYENTVKEDGNRLENFCGNPTISGGDQNRCYTIHDLQTKINNFDTFTVPKIGSTPEVNELSNLNVLKSKFDTYSDDVENAIREIEKQGCTPIASKATINRQVRFEFTSDDLFKKAAKVLVQYFGAGNTLPIDIDGIKTTTISNNDKGSKYLKVSTDAETDILGANYVKLYNLLNKNPWHNVFNGSITDAEADAPNFSKIVFPIDNTVDTTNNNVKFIDFGWILNDIQTERIGLLGDKGGNEGTIERKRKALIQEINRLVREELGFDPTIRNVFTIIICNTEAFMDILKYVAEEAEKHHNDRSSEYAQYIKPDGDGNIGISPNKGDKVFPWPTYFVNDYVQKTKSQGRKEDYPGNNGKFANWVEVRFVEDFIIALLDAQRDQKILNGETRGLAGYDNYVPINALESPAWSSRGGTTGAPLKYLDVSDPDKILKIIGERLFVALDHSVFSPIRLTNDTLGIPSIGDVKGNWSPLDSSTDDKANNNIAPIFGQIEAWNVLNVYAEELKILKVLNGKMTNGWESFRDEIINLLKAPDANGAVPLNEIDASTIVTDNGNLINTLTATQLSFDKASKYWSYNPADGIIFSNDASSSGPSSRVIIRPNPFDMAKEDLFYILEEELPNGEERTIKLTEEDNETVVSNFNTKINDITSNITFDNSFFKAKVKSDLDGAGNKQGQYVTLWKNDRLYTTLGAFQIDDQEGTGTWWNNGDIKTATPSLMGLLNYWYPGSLLSTLGGSQANAVGLNLFAGCSNTDNIDLDKFTPPVNASGTKFFELDDWMNEQNRNQNAGLFQAGNGISTVFVTTPLWLDNVISFRNGRTLKSATNFYLNSEPSSNKTYSEKEIESRNLAYLFLHTLKATPFTIRYVNKDGKFVDYTDSSPFTDNGVQSSYIWSLKAFNLVSGLAQVPRFWLLTLGAQLWRWKMFLGTKEINGKRVWNTPIPSLVQKPATFPNTDLTPSYGGPPIGDLPNGFDPLAQPGFASGMVNLPRNKPLELLPHVFPNITTSWDNTPGIQESSFLRTNDPFVSNIGYFSFSVETLNGKNPETIGDELGGKCLVYVPYFNWINTTKPTVGLSSLSSDLAGTSYCGAYPVDTAFFKTKYSYPMTYIAPYHIPYTHPERFSEESVFQGSGEGCVYTQIFNNKEGLDYLTLMPTDINGKNYYESGGNNTTTYDMGPLRSRKTDGNLGTIIQNIPDEIKDEIIKYFDDWVTNKWDDFLPIVDPVNFGSATDGFGTSYYVDGDQDQDIGGKLIGNQNSSGSAAIVLKQDKGKDLWDNLTQKVNVFNSSPKIWYAIFGDTKNLGSGLKKLKQFDSFLVSKTDFDNYIEQFVTKYKEQVTKKIDKIERENAEEQNLNGFIEDEDVKLALYRTFKSLTEKWISSTPEGKSFFNVTACDAGLSSRPGRTSLASHFQYVNRVMSDIGDIAMINVDKIRDLKQNYKMSLYNFLSDILTDNEYLFFPLPGYIDFTNQGLKKKDLEDMFKPILTLKKSSCGPTFMCMYVGGNSKQLKFNTKSNCPADLKELLMLEDDGFWVSQVDSTNGGDGGVGLPLEIKKPLEADKQGRGTGGYTAFKVVYGLQNQNYFTNIQLDQSEFSETAESLMVIDKLGQQGEGSKTSKGQNLNTVYLTRSYTCQVESLGNMMIQPMTYFDLIGVPLFNGAYLITEVTHNFKPNHAVTNFKGVRQPRTTVPIVTDAAIAMNLTFTKNANGSGQSIYQLHGGASANGGGTGKNTGSVGDITGHYKEIPKAITQLFGNPIACASKPIIGPNGGFLRANGNYHGGFDISPTVGYESYASTDPRTDNDGKPYAGRPARYPLISAYNGVVVYAGAAGGFGSPSTGNILDSTYKGTMGGWVVIRYGENDGEDPFSDNFYYFYVYGHTEPAVKPNDKVVKGQKIGDIVWPNYQPVGTQGRGTGNQDLNTGLHLHLQIHQLQSKTFNADRQYAIIPSPFLNQQPGEENCIVATGTNTAFLNSQPTAGGSSGGGDAPLNVSAQGLDETGATPLDRFFNTILRGESKSYADYNYYKNGSVLVSYLEGTSNTANKYTPLTKPLNQYTIGEVKAFQNNQRNATGQLWATGRYQIIPDTLKGLVKSGEDSKIYDKAFQDVLAQRILDGRSNIKKYLNKQVADTDDNLALAVLDLAKTWSSIGVPFATQGAKKYVQKGESYYSGGGDRASLSPDLAASALRRYRAELNGETFVPNNSNTNTNANSGSGGSGGNTGASTGTIIVIGDSLTPSVSQGMKYAGIQHTLGANNVEYKVGWSIGALTSSLNNLTPNNNVTKVVVSIGTNGFFNPNDNFSNFASSLKKAYPKVQKVAIVKGAWGTWGFNNSSKDPSFAYCEKPQFATTATYSTNLCNGNCSCPKVEIYYTKFKQQISGSFTSVDIIEPFIGNGPSHQGYAGGDIARFNLIGSYIKDKIGTS